MTELRGTKIGMTREGHSEHALPEVEVVVHGKHKLVMMTLSTLDDKERVRL